MRGGSPLGPVRGLQQRMHDVDNSEAGVDGVVHVATQRLSSGHRLDERSFTLVDCSVQDVEYRRLEECLPVGKVSIQGGDTDTGPLGNCVSGRFTANFQDQLDRSVEEAPPVPSSVGSRRRVRRTPWGITHKAEYMPPVVGHDVREDRRTL